MTDEQRRERQSYRTGFAAAAILTAVPFALVATGTARGVTLVVIALFALVQIVAQVRWFLHIDLSRQKREDLQLVLFSSIILFLMAGGTIWVLGDLSARMLQ